MLHHGIIDRFARAVFERRSIRDDSTILPFSSRNRALGRGTDCRRVNHQLFEECARLEEEDSGVPEVPSIRDHLLRNL